MVKAFVLSLPERLVRSLAAVLGGGVHETAELVLPRFVRRSRLYEATAKNLLRSPRARRRGGAARPASSDAPRGEIAVRKGAGNAVELGSIAAFGFSPLWLLAAASDVAHGTRIYLDALVAELKAGGVLAEETEVATIDELLGALERGAGTARALIDLPPLELSEFRRSLAEFRASALAAAAGGARASSRPGAAAARERRSLLEVSTGLGLAFLISARTVGRDHLATPTARTGSRCATRASPPTRAGSPGRTARPSPGTSTMSARASPSGSSDGCRATRDVGTLEPVKRQLR